MVTDTAPEHESPARRVSRAAAAGPAPAREPKRLDGRRTDIVNALRSTPRYALPKSNGRRGSNARGAIAGPVVISCSDEAETLRGATRPRTVPKTAHLRRSHASTR